MLTDTHASPYARMSSLPAGACTTSGGDALGDLRRRALEITIPSMGAIMFDPDVAHAVDNFLVAAGREPGEHCGPSFMDGDLYKWLEAAAVAAPEMPGYDAAGHLARAAEAMAAAQQPDGYLHTKITIAQRAGVDVQPLTDRMLFETYNLGHLMTLACAHLRMTGGEELLGIARRAADYLADAAAEAPDRVADCNICPSHYMGVVELYRTTGERRYLDLAGRLLNLHGGKGRTGGDDNQDVVAVRDLETVAGHAVRANYLYAGMADYALETGDGAIMAALQRLWDDLVGTKLYVTGGCGALYDGASPDACQDYGRVTKVHQSYGRSYQLPQTTAYNESCAALGLVMFAWRMLMLTGESRFADVIERVLHNALPAMIGADGKSYFYTNPLRQVRDYPLHLRRAGDPSNASPPASEARDRQDYMTACFCCPPNIARVLAELPYYVYAHAGSDLWVHQFVSGSVRTTWSGVPVTVTQETHYPASGRIVINVRAESPVKARLRIRVPGWLDAGAARVDGAPPDRVEHGYAVIERCWHDDTIVLELPMRPRLIATHRFAEETAQQVCVVRGPVVYCVESVDLPQDVSVESVALPSSIRWDEQRGAGLFEGYTLLSGEGARLPSQPGDRLYAELDSTRPVPMHVRLVPYARWANRGPGEMSVWLPVLR